MPDATQYTYCPNCGGPVPVSDNYAEWIGRWYGERWELLKNLFRGTPLEDEARKIMASGTRTTMDKP